MVKYIQQALIAVTLIVVAACSDDIQGRYSSQARLNDYSTDTGKAYFDFQANNIVHLTFPGNETFELKYQYEETRVLVYSANPEDGFYLQVKDNGKRLECPQCPNLGVPGVWSKE